MPLLLHRIEHNLDQLKQDGCQLVEPKEMFKALMVATMGDPCTTGCTYFEGGKCPAYLKYHSIEIDKRAQKKQDHVRAHTDQSGLIGGKWSGKTIRQIAEIEGISLSEARRRKQAGNYT